MVGMKLISFYKNDAVLTDDERKKYDKALDWLKDCVRDKDRINIYNKTIKKFSYSLRIYNLRIYSER
jgi:hypothetical protein